MTMSRELMGKIVDEVFDGAIEDASVIEQIYEAIKKHQTPSPSTHMTGMDEEDRTPVPEGFDAAQWRKADDVCHAMALVADDTECVKIVYAALATTEGQP